MLERFKKTIVCSWTEHSEDCEISGASGLGQEHRTKYSGGRGPGEGGKTGRDVSVGMMGEWYQWGFQCKVDNYLFRITGATFAGIAEKARFSCDDYNRLHISGIKQQKKEKIGYCSFPLISSLL